MKQRIAMLLAALMLVLTACGGGDAPDPSGTPQSGGAPTPTSTPALQTAGRPAASGEPVMSTAGTIQETVLLDQDGVKITATALTYTSYSAELSLLLENDSGQDLSFRANTMACACNSVNGYMVDDGYLNADVPSGKKAKETLSFSFSELFMLGITEIASLEVGFDIQDSGNDTFLRTEPLPLETSLAAGYDYGAPTYRESINGGVLSTLYDFTVDHFSEEVLFDRCGVRVISQAVITNMDGEHGLFLEVENTSQAPVSVAVQDFYLNGLLVEEGVWTRDRLNPGKRRVIPILYSNMLEGPFWDILGLKELGSLAFSVELEDGEGNVLSAPEELTVTMPGGPASFDGSGTVVYEGEGVRVLFKDLVPDGSSYSDDIHVLLLAENSGEAPVYVQVSSSSVSVNGFMTGAWGCGAAAAPGRWALLDLTLLDSSLETNGITGIKDVESVEASLELSDGRYHTLAESVVTIDLAPAGP